MDTSLLQAEVLAQKTKEVFSKSGRILSDKDILDALYNLEGFGKTLLEMEKEKWK